MHLERQLSLPTRSSITRSARRRQAGAVLRAAARLPGLHCLT